MRFGNEAETTYVCLLLEFAHNTCPPSPTHTHPHTHIHTHKQSPTVCELVRQHMASGDVFDPDSGKCHEVSNVCYLCTTHTSSRHHCTTHTSPRHQLRPQFMKHFAVLHWDGYK